MKSTSVFRMSRLSLVLMISSIVSILILVHNFTQLNSTLSLPRTNDSMLQQSHTVIKSESPETLVKIIFSNIDRMKEPRREQPPPTSAWQQKEGLRLHIQSIPRNSIAPLPLLIALCHDSRDEMKVHLWNSQQENNITFIIPFRYTPTMMGASSFFANILPDLLSDILSCETVIPWFGVVSPDLLFNTRYLSPVEQVLQDYQSMLPVHVVAYGDLDERHNLQDKQFWDEQEQCCPGLVGLVKWILLYNEENEEKIAAFFKLSTVLIRSFSRFNFIVRPGLMSGFIQWLTDIWIYIQTDSFVQSILWSNCTYKIEKAYGTDAEILPGHSILGDWLAAYYYYSRTYYIRTVTSTTIESNFSASNNSSQFIRTSGFYCPSAPTHLKSIYNVSTWSDNSMRSSSLLPDPTMQANPDGIASVFLLCHDKECQSRMQGHCDVYPWLHPFVLPLSYMGQSLFYTNRYTGIFKNSNHMSWIGTIPETMLRNSLLDLPLIHTMILDEQLLQDNAVDVLGFWNPIIFRNLPEILAEENPHLWPLLEYTLTAIGENQRDIDRLHSLVFFKPFYGLAFVARPHVVRAFTEWLSRVALFIFSDPKAHTLLTQSIGPGLFNPQSAFQNLGEKLAPYFTNTRGFNIIKNPNEYKLFVHERENLVQCHAERDMVPSGLGELYEVFIYYHIGMVNNWKKIVLKQLEKLEVCGLGYIAHSMLITFDNPSPDSSTSSSIREIRSLLYQYDFATRLSMRFVDASGTFPYEAMIMEQMSSFCHESLDAMKITTDNQKKQIVFYFHDKGVSKYTETDETLGYQYFNANQWRLYMEAFLLDRPSLCIRAILNHGACTCGVNLAKSPYKHYSGNFWASSCDYIVKLPRTRDKWRPNDKGFPDWWYNHIGPELWIGNFSDRIDGEEHQHVALFNIANDLYEGRADFDLFQWIFDDVSLYVSGERNSTISLGDHYPVEVYVTNNMSGLWNEYHSSKKKNISTE